MKYASSLGSRESSARNSSVPVMNQEILLACVDVLLVEDDPVWVGFYSRLLEEHGIKFEVAMTIEDAVLKLAARKPHYVLCDGTDWDEVIRLCVDAGCMVVIQTGDPGSFGQYGAAAVVSKLYGPRNVMDIFLEQVRLASEDS